MFLYPFKTIWLKTGSGREDIAGSILQQTYLSDAGYKKSDNLTKFFYGLVNENEFVLENIGNRRIPEFFEGDIVGVGDETYVKLRMGALKHVRIYILYWLLLIAGMFFLIRAMFGLDTVDIPIQSIFGVVMLFLAGYGYYFTRQFHQKVQSGIDFFRGLLQAEVISGDEVPPIFKR
ncbi:MAG: hypothetical protein ACK5FT_08015 [Sphingomonadales bacterium]|jgi:hypothetical protein